MAKFSRSPEFGTELQREVPLSGGRAYPNLVESYFRAQRRKDSRKRLYQKISSIHLAFSLKYRLVIYQFVERRRQTPGDS